MACRNCGALSSYELFEIEDEMASANDWNKPPKWCEEIQKQAKALAKTLEPSESFKKMAATFEKDKQRLNAMYKRMGTPESYKELVERLKRDQEQAERLLKPFRDIEKRHKEQ